jgi:hypothetical protein
MMAEDEKEAKVQESQVFNMSEVEGEEDLRDAWGRPADADEAVDLADSRYSGMKVEGADGLKAELKSREEAGRTFDKASIKSKRDLVAALEADDAAQAAEAGE